MTPVVYLLRRQPQRRLHWKSALPSKRDRLSRRVSPRAIGICDADVYETWLLSPTKVASSIWARSPPTSSKPGRRHLLTLSHRKATTVGRNRLENDVKVGWL